VVARRFRAQPPHPPADGERDEEQGIRSRQARRAEQEARKHCADGPASFVREQQQGDARKAQEGREARTHELDLEHLHGAIECDQRGGRDACARSATAPGDQRDERDAGKAEEPLRGVDARGSIRAEPADQGDEVGVEGADGEGFVAREQVAGNDPAGHLVIHPRIEKQDVLQAWVGEGLDQMGAPNGGGGDEHGCEPESKMHYFENDLFMMPLRRWIPRSSDRMVIETPATPRPRPRCQCEGVKRNEIS